MQWREKKKREKAWNNIVLNSNFNNSCATSVGIYKDTWILDVFRLDILTDLPVTLFSNATNTAKLSVLHSTGTIFSHLFSFLNENFFTPKIIHYVWQNIILSTFFVIFLFLFSTF